MTVQMRLYTFTLSHFSEKTRWTLDAAGLDYVEQPLVPGLHMLKTRRLSRRATTVPILAADGELIQDSARITAWLAQHRAPFPLLPTNAAQRAQVLAIEARFARVGRQVMRLAYSRALDDPEGVRRVWSVDATPLQSRLLRLVFPPLSMLMRRTLKLNADAMVKARADIAAALDEVETLLATARAEGRRHLVGDSLSIADITVCALLSPLVVPRSHPVYTAPLFREGIAEITREWQSREAFRWVRDFYDRERRPRPGSSFVAARDKLA